MKVTACLITWRRQYNLPKIIASLTRYPFITQIMIMDNSKGENIINYARYKQAERADNDIIYVQDDDCVINNVDEIYAHFVADPHNLSHAGTKGYQDVIKDNIYGDKQMALVGWGAIFNKSWVRQLDRYLKVYGKDYCFYRETDRIFTMLMNRHHNFVVGDIEHLDGETDQYALSSQKDHLDYKKLAIERAKNL